MAADPRQVEKAYVDDVLAKLRQDGRINIERVDIVGEFPDTTLVVMFRTPDRACLFGVRDSLWDEDRDPEALNATYTSLRWIEALDDSGELPHRCAPDSMGVTWLDLWGDWS